MVGRFKRPLSPAKQPRFYTGRHRSRIARRLATRLQLRPAPVGGPADAPIRPGESPVE